MNQTTSVAGQGAPSARETERQPCSPKLKSPSHFRVQARCIAESIQEIVFAPTVPVARDPEWLRPGVTARLRTGPIQQPTEVLDASATSSSTGGTGTEPSGLELLQMAWFRRIYDFFIWARAWAHQKVDPIACRLRKWRHVLWHLHSGRLAVRLLRVRRRMRLAASS
jgi:hypothetical protein